MTQEKDFTTSIVTDQSAATAFNAIINVRGWWQGQVTGNTDTLNEAFTYQMKTLHFSRQKIVALIPGKKVVWLVTESNLSFLDKKEEWTGTKITFDITSHQNKTTITFTHAGLVPAIECYSDCSRGWTKLIEQSLLSLINTGKGVDVF